MLGQINFLFQSDLLSGDGVVQVPTPPRVHPVFKGSQHDPEDY